MKKVLLSLMLLCAFEAGAQSFTRQGVTYTQSVKKSTGQLTGFNYTDSKGNNYPIYITESGRCYILKTSSKTGKEYKSYLKEDLCIDICNRLGRVYKK